VAACLHYRRDFFSLRTRVLPDYLEPVAVVVLTPHDPSNGRLINLGSGLVVDTGTLDGHEDMMPDRCLRLLTRAVFRAVRIGADRSRYGQ
jgi:hypothetical protein